MTKNILGALLTCSLLISCGKQEENNQSYITLPDAAKELAKAKNEKEYQMSFGMFADLLRDDPRSYYHDWLDDPQLTKATDLLGNTNIDLTLIQQGQVLKSGWQVEEKNMPWTSWYYPYKETRMFLDQGRRLKRENDGTLKIDDRRDLCDRGKRMDELAPLCKYDWIRQKIYKDQRKSIPIIPGSNSGGSATRHEFNTYGDLHSNSKSWEGLCDSWAQASILFPQPMQPKKLRGFDGRREFDVELSVSDQKALLLKTFENRSSAAESYTLLGQVYTGLPTTKDPYDPNWSTKGLVYMDLFPDQFHRVVEQELQIKKKPFVMDRDPGVEIWSHPVFGYKQRISKVPSAVFEGIESKGIRQKILEQPNSVVYVETTLLYTDLLSVQNEVGFGNGFDSIESTEPKVTARTYAYLLWGEQQGSSLKVNGGAWLDAKDSSGYLMQSRTDHPDFFITLNDTWKIKRERKSNNPEIETKIVDQILGL